MDLTADFVYCRLHGSKELYASGYDDKSLDCWARRIAHWAQGREPKDAERVINRDAPKLSSRDVYVYFDNDRKVRASFDALTLTDKVRKAMARNYGNFRAKAFERGASSDRLASNGGA